LLLGVGALAAGWPRGVGAPSAEGERRAASAPGAPKGSARLEPLTTLAGIEASPTFSPDGRQFAYAFDSEPLREDGRPRFDLWVRMVGGFDARRLTSDDSDELAPSW